MQVFKEMEAYDHEKIMFVRDTSVGLKAIIAVHNTTLGPALGGTRFWDYATEEDALYDVLRLSRGMTLKNAGAGLKLGGGKAVILGDPKKLRSREFFHAYGRAVKAMGGLYYTAEDVNTKPEDIKHIKEVTDYVTGTPEISGDPGPFTAIGVFHGLRAGVNFAFGTPDLKGKVISVQGLGSVGYRVAKLAHEAGAKLKVFDINAEVVNKAVKELGAQAVSKDEILITECDVLAPCALGAVLSQENIGTIKAKVIAGSANNIFVDQKAAEMYGAKGGVYCPDFIVNAGGVINCAAEITDKVYDSKAITVKCEALYDVTGTILKQAKAKGISTYQAAEEYSFGIIAAAKK